VLVFIFDGRAARLAPRVRHRQHQRAPNAC
jgi:hypothetical protein